MKIVPRAKVIDPHARDGVPALARFSATGVFSRAVASTLLNPGFQPFRIVMCLRLHGHLLRLRLMLLRLRLLRLQLLLLRLRLLRLRLLQLLLLRLRLLQLRSLLLRLRLILVLHGPVYDAGGWNGHSMSCDRITTTVMSIKSHGSIQMHHMQVMIMYKGGTITFTMTSMRTSASIRMSTHTRISTNTDMYTCISKCCTIHVKHNVHLQLMLQNGMIMPFASSSSTSSSTSTSTTSSSGTSSSNSTSTSTSTRAVAHPP